MHLDPECARIRTAALQSFVRSGRGPTLDDLAAQAGLSSQAARAALHRLRDAHVVVLQPDSDAIWMAMPFSGVPTAFRVTAERPDATAGAWWANCAWDALGIAAMLAGANLAPAHAPIHIATTCPDCEQPLGVTVRSDAPTAADAVRIADMAAQDGTPVVHFAVPASRWWDDIGFT
jgi:Alkylmercury lyase